MPFFLIFIHLLFWGNAFAALKSTPSEVFSYQDVRINFEMDFLPNDKDINLYLINERKEKKHIGLLKKNPLTKKLELTASFKTKIHNLNVVAIQNQEIINELEIKVNKRPNFIEAIKMALDKLFKKTN